LLSFGIALVGAFLVPRTNSAPLQDVEDTGVIQVFVDPAAAALQRQYETESDPIISAKEPAGTEASRPLVRRVAESSPQSSNLVEASSVAELASLQRSEYEMQTDSVAAVEGTNGLARVAVPKECTGHFDPMLVSQAKDVGGTHKDASTVDMTCPPKDFKTELFDTQVLLNTEYFHRAKGGHCNVAKGMWKDASVVPALRCKYEAVANLFKLSANDVVLDWGAGCGHALDIIAKEYSLLALGLDLVDENVEWATDNMKHIKKTCLTDGSDLSFIKADSLDAFLSNGAVHHLPQTSQCRLMKDHVLRVLRPGGCAWFGWQGVEGSGSEPAVNEDFWRSECFSLGEASVFTENELKAFGTNEFKSSNAYSLFVCKPN